MKQKSRKKQKKQALIPVPVVLAAVILLCFAGITSARYVMQKEKSTVAEAEEFYFTSDFLKEESEDASYFIDPKTEEFTIKLFNYADSIRITAGEIEYEITVDGGTYESKSSLKGPKQAEAEIKIKPDNPLKASESEKIIKVTAKSSSPYSKTLTAEFIMKLGNQFVIEDKKGNRAAALTMICADDKKDITITLPEGVIPDKADDRVSYDSATRKCLFRSDGYGIYSLVLLKKEAEKVLSGAEDGIFANSIIIEASQ